MAGQSQLSRSEFQNHSRGNRLTRLSGTALCSGYSYRPKLSNKSKHSEFLEAYFTGLYVRLLQYGRYIPHKMFSTVQSVHLAHERSPRCRIIYRVSQEEWTKLRENVPYVKLYRYNPKHLYPKLNGYGDNGQRSLKL